MGCSSSQPTKTSTTIIKGTLKKHSIQSITKNQNKFLSQNENYYKNQKPEIPFNDKIFPPNLDSYFGKENGKFIDKNEKRRNNSILPIEIKEENIIFKHYYEIWGNNSDIFYNNNISIEDIKLGQIGDAYFVSVISSLAEFPKLIIQLFKTLKIKKDEPIEINIKIDGKWKVVLIDDYFPINKENNKPIFSDAPNKNLWGVFLEKAWAKINKGYVNILCGYPKEVFEFFTPFPTIPIEISLENKENLWKNIYNCDINNCIMTCFIREKNNDLKKYGLICNHCFSLITAKEGIVNKENVRLLKLRNPFGEGEWNGDYSDKSEKWTNELKAAFNFEEAKDDGIFWIDFDNFIKYFAIVSICVPLRPIVCYNLEIEEKNSDKLNYLKVKIIKSGILSITIHKELKKFHSDCLDDQNDAIENIIVAKIDKENKKLIYFDSAYNETSSCNTTPGEYLILFGVDYKTKEVPGRKYRITLSGNCEFKISNVECDVDYSILKCILIPRIESLEKYKKKMDNDKIILFCGNRFENSAFCWFYLKNPQNEDIAVRPVFVMKNFKKIEDIPNVIKLKPNVPVVFLGNRISANMSFQSGISGTIKNLNGKEKEIELNQENINKVFNDSNYNDMEIEIEM